MPETRSSERAVPFRVGWLFLLAFGLVTGAVLALEILQTRILSVLTWYSLAFLVITMGLFGLTVGALRVYLRPDLYAPERLPARLRHDCVAFAALVPASYLALLLVPLRVEAAATTVFLFAVFAAILAVPFVPAGAVVAAVLTRTPLPIGRLYAVDLFGAALGALAVPVLLMPDDAGTAIFLLASGPAVAATLFAVSAGDRPGARRGAWVSGAMLVLALVQSSTDRGLVPVWVKGQPESRRNIDQEYWNSYSRVVVTPLKERKASPWGKGNRCENPMVNQRRFTIDGEAETVLYDAGGDLDSLDFLLCDVAHVAHHLRREGAVAVVGVGGSPDIQASILFGHDPVVGIEMNRTIVDLLRGPLGETAGIRDHPAVRLVNDEGRSYLTRSDEEFEVVQISFTDTWAATGAGAHAFGENGLYTLEGWRTFLDRLAPNGLFSMSRWYRKDEVDETTRMASLAVATLLDRGVANPRSHIALVGVKYVATLIVGRNPLASEEIDRLNYVAGALGFDLIAVPGRPCDDPLLEGILASRSLDELNEAALTDLYDLRPTTDDRPFFFNMIRLGAIHRLPAKLGGVIKGNRLASATLVLSALASLALALVAVVVPLLLRARPRELGADLWAGLAYFTLIGVGFLIVEIGLLQRLSLVLGHPSYSILVVLPGIIAATGLGSLLSDRLPLDRAPWCYAYPVVIAAAVAATAWALGELAPVVQPAGLTRRVLAGLAFTGVPGLALGAAFPAGMRLFRSTLDDETPWFWGMNGIGSVVGGGTAVMISLQLGISSLFVVSALLYLLLIPAVAVIRRK